MFNAPDLPSSVSFPFELAIYRPTLEKSVTQVGFNLKVKPGGLYIKIHKQSHKVPLLMHSKVYEAVNFLSDKIVDVHI